MSRGRRYGFAIIAVACSLLAAPASIPEKAGKERREETIARCLRDLQSSDVLVRRKASLLLGKYSTPEAEAALIGCLADSDPQIRLGAMVSLTEDRSLPREASQGIIRLIGDENVFVRRYATALLGDAFGYPVRGNLRTFGNYRLSPRWLPKTDSQEWKQVHQRLLKALGDEDDSVRNNVLTVCRLFGFPVPRDILLDFLQDASPSIRIHAFWLLNRQVTDVQVFLGDIARLLRDGHEEVKAEVCSALPAWGRAVEPALRQLYGDASGPIRVLAADGLCRLGVPDAGKLLKSVLLDARIDGANRLMIIHRALFLPPREAQALYGTLLEGDSVDLAERAMEMLSRPGSGIAKAGFFVPYLTSAKGNVPERALLGIRMRTQTLTLEDCLTMVTKGSQKAREFVLNTGLLRLKDTERLEVLAEACMDEHKTVRLQAIRRLGELRPAGWQDMMLATLEDEDLDIASQAADRLCRFPSAEAQKALRSFLSRCRDRRLQLAIQRVLLRRF